MANPLTGTSISDAIFFPLFDCDQTAGAWASVRDTLVIFFSLNLFIYKYKYASRDRLYWQLKKERIIICILASLKRDWIYP